MQEKHLWSMDAPKSSKGKSYANFTFFIILCWHLGLCCLSTCTKYDESHWLIYWGDIFAVRNLVLLRVIWKRAILWRHNKNNLHMNALLKLCPPIPISCQSLMRSVTANVHKSDSGLYLARFEREKNHHKLNWWDQFMSFVQRKSSTCLEIITLHYITLHSCNVAPNLKDLNNWSVNVTVWKGETTDYC